MKAMSIIGIIFSILTLSLVVVNIPLNFSAIILWGVIGLLYVISYSIVGFVTRTMSIMGIIFFTVILILLIAGILGTNLWSVMLWSVVGPLSAIPYSIVGLVASIKNGKAINQSAVQTENVHRYSKKIVKEKTFEEMEFDTYKNELTILNRLINNQKGFVVISEKTEEIMAMIRKLCNSQDEAIRLLNTYQDLFHKDLINDIKKLNSSNSSAATKRNLNIFIDFDLIEKEYPHNPIS